MVSLSRYAAACGLTNHKLWMSGRRARRAASLRGALLASRRC